MRALMRAERVAAMLRRFSATELEAVVPTDSVESRVRARRRIAGREKSLSLPPLRAQTRKFSECTRRSKTGRPISKAPDLRHIFGKGVRNLLHRPNAQPTVVAAKTIPPDHGGQPALHHKTTQQAHRTAQHYTSPFLTSMREVHSPSSTSALDRDSCWRAQLPARTPSRFRS